MKVAFVTPPPQAGGIGKYAESLHQEIQDNMQVSKLDLIEKSSLFDRIGLMWRTVRTDAGIIHVQFEYGFFKPKLIFAWMFFPLVFTLSRVSDTRLIITMHEVWEPDAVGGKRLHWMYVWVTHTLLGFTSDSLIFLSQNAADAFNTPINANKTVIHHGVDVGSTKEIKTSKAKEEFGFESDETVISQIGYVSQRKGTGLFLELAKQYPKKEFLIAGGPRREEDRDYYEKIVERAPSNVTVTGVLSDRRFHAAFVATDAAVLAYNDIRQSGILNWCFAYEVPALCRRIPYFERVAKEGGGIALFNDRSEAIKNFRSVLKNRKKLASEMKDYREAHSVNRIADRHYSLYREVASEEPLTPQD